jgi:hypothetical protein
MGKSAGSPPSAPDPYTVAGAETQYGENTAAYNAALNRFNVNTPYGSQTWSVAGSPSGSGYTLGGGGGGTPSGIMPGGGAGGAYGPGGAVGAPAGSPAPGTAGSNVFGLGNTGSSPYGPTTVPTGNAPQYTETVGLAPAQQTLLNQQNAQNISLGGGAQSNLVNQINQNSATGAPNFGDSRQQAQDALYKNQTQYLDPRFKEQGTLLSSQLANQGVVPGTEAYDNAMRDFNNSKQQAYQGAMDTAIGGASTQQGQNIQNYAALQNQPINQLSALRGQGQVQTPNFQQPGMTNAQGADIGSAFAQQYGGNLAGYNANVAAQNANTQGLYGLGASALMYAALA